jgi:hypothetical protein
MAEMTVNEFVNSFIEAGFDFTYRATNGEVIIDGNVSKKGEHTKKIIKITENKNGTRND